LMARIALASGSRGAPEKPATVIGAGDEVDRSARLVSYVDCVAT